MISSCTTCGSRDWQSTSIDHTGILAVCVNGHYNFDASIKQDGDSFTAGSIRCTGTVAIGHGARVIGRIRRR